MSSKAPATTNVLVTGANGFLGRNLCVHLARRPEVELLRYDIDRRPEDLESALAGADVIFHLAGVNRPENVGDFMPGNAGLTQQICDKLAALGRTPLVVLSSSIQVDSDNPYGRSKLAAEKALRQFCDRTGTPGRIYRLKNLFGKWSRPNYNSVTATFCHNIAAGRPIEISDAERLIDLTYVDDVVAAFLAELMRSPERGCTLADDLPSHRISLADLAHLIKSFRDHRENLFLPDFSSSFIRALYATYLSHLPPDDFAYQLGMKADNRGSLAEFLKSPSSGQVFISRTRPGITRGNHYHHTKTEKFLVVEGKAIVRFRHITGGEVIEYEVSGEQYRVVDIPPGYTHSIENIGPGELVTLFWASEVFDPQRPDTYGLPVV